MKAFMFYIDDWLASKNVAMMDAHEERGYLRLLMAEATDPLCSLPDDDKQLAVLSLLGRQWFKPSRDSDKRIMDMTSGAKLRRQFFLHDGRLFNERLLREWERWREVSLSRSENGKRGGRPRKQQLSSEESLSLTNGKLIETNRVGGVSGIVQENSFPIRRNSRSVPWGMDEPYCLFRDAYLAIGGPATEADWEDAYPAWKLLNIGEKLAAIEHVKTCDGAHVRLPHNYIGKHEWDRPARPAPRSKAEIAMGGI